MKHEDSVLFCAKFMEEFKVEALRVSLKGFKLLTYLLTYLLLLSLVVPRRTPKAIQNSHLSISKMTANITSVADI